MASQNVERIQAPYGGVNLDASPDYIGATESPLMYNMLPSRPGKVVMRGSLSAGVSVNGATPNPALAFWAYDDVALLKTTDSGGVKTWRLTSAFTAKTDVTATLVESPASSRHARYGASVYGAIVDAANPQLGKWDGAASAIVPQANAPFQFVDLQPFAQRLFVLGGSLPGTTTPIINSGRVLFWTDPDPAADLSLLASWRDDTVTVPVINQLQYDGDDTPVGLAGCGRYMAILGSRSVNILTGSGASSFAVRNLTRNLGCTHIDSIVEVDDGFYFMTERGYAFCDGATVQIVSEKLRNLMEPSSIPLATNCAAVFGHGYLALAQNAFTWLFHVPTHTWTLLTSGRFPTSSTAYSVHRSLTYPLIWDGSTMWLGNNVTTWPGTPGGFDSGVGGSDVAIPARVLTRWVRLGSPTSRATIRRVLIDASLDNVLAAWTVAIKDPAGVTLSSGSIVGEASNFLRQRTQIESYGEASVAYLDITYAPTGTPGILIAELYDAWVEFTPGRDEPGF